MRINIGEATLEVGETRHATLMWGDANEMSISAFKDPDRKNPVGSRTITKSGECKGQIVNLVKVIGDNAGPGKYYFSASVGGKSADFEWWKPEIISNSTAEQPDSTRIQTLQDPNEKSIVIPWPPAQDDPVQLSNPNVEATKPAKDGGSKPVGQDDPPKPRELPVAEVERITEVLTRAHRDLKFFTAKPKELNRAMFVRLDNHVARAGGVINNEYGNDKNLDSLRTTWFECNTMLAELSEKLKAREKARKPEPKPEPTLEPNEDYTQLENRVGGIEKDIEGIKGTLDGHTKDLKKSEKKTAEIDAEVKGVHTEVKGLREEVRAGTTNTSEELAKLTRAITGSGSGGNNNSDASDGGKASADKQPWSLGGSWLGVIVTLAILFVIGLIALCAFQAGWIHKSPAPATVGATMGSAQQLPLVIMITNTVSQTTLPTGGQQAVAAPTPITSSEDLAKIAEEMKAIRAGQAEFLRKDAGGLVRQPAATKSGNGGNGGVSVFGNGNVVGNGNTVNNYLLPPPTSSGNGGQTVTQPTARVTSGDTTSTSSGLQMIRSREDRPTYKAPHWSPTLMTGFICVPVAADGSGSEGFWVYQNPPVPGQTT